jgi:hypothetical protein
MHEDMIERNLLSTFVPRPNPHLFSINTWLDQHTLFQMVDVDPSSCLIAC